MKSRQSLSKSKLLTGANLRAGASTVEFAFVLPIMFTFLFGAIEFSRANQVRNATAYSAYQGCRQAIIPGGTAAGATSAAQNALAAASITKSTITVSPSTITNSTSTISVTVSVNLDQVGWISPMFTKGKTITRTCTLTREQTN